MEIPFSSRRRNGSTGGGEWGSGRGGNNSVVEELAPCYAIPVMRRMVLPIIVGVSSMCAPCYAEFYDFSLRDEITDSTVSCPAGEDSDISITNFYSGVTIQGPPAPFRLNIGFGVHSGLSGSIIEGGLVTIGLSGGPVDLSDTVFYNTTLVGNISGGGFQDTTFFNGDLSTVTAYDAGKFDGATADQDTKFGSNTSLKSLFTILPGSVELVVSQIEAAPSGGGMNVILEVYVKEGPLLSGTISVEHAFLPNGPWSPIGTIPGDGTSYAGTVTAPEGGTGFIRAVTP